MTAGALLVVSVLILLSWTRQDGGPRLLGRGQVFALLGVHSAALIATQTRGAIFGAVVGALVWAVLAVRRRRDLAIFAVLAVPVAIVLGRGVFEAFLLRGESSEQLRSLNSRTDLWSEAFRFVEESPLIGRGYFSARELFLDSIGLGGAHNAYIEVLVSAGIVGAVALVVLLVRSTRVLVRLPPPPPPGGDRGRARRTARQRAHHPVLGAGWHRRQRVVPRRARLARGRRPAHRPAQADVTVATPARSSGSAWALVGTAAGAIGNFALLVVVSVVYGRTLFGVFSAVTALFQLGTVLFRLGAEIGATYFIARGRAAGRSGEIRHVLSAAIVPVALVSLAVTAIGLAAAGPIADALSEDGTTDQYASMLRILALCIPIATIGEVLLGATRGFASMGPTVLASNLGRQVGQLVTVVVAASVTHRADVLAIAWSLPYLCTVIYPWWWLRRALSGVGPAAGATPWADFWRYTTPQAANAGVQGGLEKADIILLGRMTGADATAVYSLANRFVHVVVLARYAINVSEAAAFAAAFARGDTAELRRHAERVATWTLLVCGPPLLLLALFPGAILGLVDSGYDEGATALALLAGGALISLLLGPVDGLLLMSGASGRSFVNSAIALAVNLGLNLWLIPRHGPTGAAISWVIAIVLARVLGAVPLLRRHGVTGAGPTLARAGTAVAATIGLVGLVARFGAGDRPGALVATAVVGGAAYLLVSHRHRETLMVDELVGGLTARRRRVPDAVGS